MSREAGVRKPGSKEDDFKNRPEIKKNLKKYLELAEIKNILSSDGVRRVLSDHCGNNKSDGIV